MSKDNPECEKAKASAKEKFDDKLKGFLLEDYKLKVGYLTAHLGRMWTRFNFFLTAEVALIAYLFTAARGDTPVMRQFIVIEDILSIIWWGFGAQDRFMVRLYKEQIKDVVKRLLSAELRALAKEESQGEQPGKEISSEWTTFVDNYAYTGETEQTAKAIEEADKSKGERWNWLTEWRSEHLSITRLAAVVPLIAFVIWLVMLLVIQIRTQSQAITT